MISTSCERFDVSRGHHAFALLLEIQHSLVAVVQFQHDALEVEQDVDDVFLHAVDRGVLVQHAVDLDFGRREAGHRGQQHPAQRVAQRMAIAALERLHRHFRMERRDGLHIDDSRLQKAALHKGDPLREIRNITAQKTHGPAGQLWNGGPRSGRGYFEYSSTTSDSLMVAGSSERCGFALNVPLSALMSTSIHSG